MRQVRFSSVRSCIGIPTSEADPLLPTIIVMAGPLWDLDVVRAIRTYWYKRENNTTTGLDRP
jgi:hypothetical protein